MASTTTRTARRRFRARTRTDLRALFATRLRTTPPAVPVPAAEDPAPTADTVPFGVTHPDAAAYLDGPVTDEERARIVANFHAACDRIAGTELVPGGPVLTEPAGSMFCECGAHVALVGTDQLNVRRAMQYAADGYTPSDVPHVCPVAARPLAEVAPVTAAAEAVDPTDADRQRDKFRRVLASAPAVKVTPAQVRALRWLALADATAPDAPRADVVARLVAAGLAELAEGNTIPGPFTVTLTAAGRTAAA
jgi:hypothetical protein